jgi:cell fate regulator YaaT (PSP1 superfamily)
MPPIIAIQFGSVGKRYHFDAQGITDLQPGDRVVVETSRGKQLGIVNSYVTDEQTGGRSCKPIERRATPRDLAMQQHWDSQALGVLVTCAERAEQLGLYGYRFVKAEYNFDGSQVTIHYTADRKRPEQTQLERDLRRALRARVELYQVGPRDLAKELDGLGACGIQRCCSRFLVRFDSVSIRMAKVQQISLTPSEVTGLCGRLRCCLSYEHEQYAEEARGLPKRGKDVVTPYGKGRVMEVRTMAGVVVVDVEGVRHVVQREDVGSTEFTAPPPDEATTAPSWESVFPDATDELCWGSDSAKGDTAPVREPRKRPKRSHRPEPIETPRPSVEPTDAVVRQPPQTTDRTSHSKRSSRRRRRSRSKSSSQPTDRPGQSE